MSHFMWPTATVLDGTNMGKQVLGQAVLSASVGRKRKNCPPSGHTQLMEDGRAGYEHQNKNETEGEKVLEKEKEQAGEAQKKKSHSGRPRREHLSAV